MSSFVADKIVMDGLTFDDVLLIPAYSEVLPKTELDEEDVEDIYEYFRESDTDSMEDAMDELGDTYTADQVRLVRIKFISEMGN